MIDALECPVCPGLAEECKLLIKSWRLRTWHSDFDVELCHIVVKFKECIDDYRWRPEPTVPADYNKFLALHIKDRRIFLDQHPLFLTQGKVAIYLNDRDMVRNINKRNFTSLSTWKKLSINEEARGVVDYYLKTYFGRMAIPAPVYV